jgi:hypothetical protein
MNSAPLENLAIFLLFPFLGCEDAEPMTGPVPGYANSFEGVWPMAGLLSEYADGFEDAEPISGALPGYADGFDDAEPIFVFFRGI